MKNPTLGAKKPPHTGTSPDIEAMHARITAREDRSTWKRLNIRLPEDDLDDLKVVAVKTKTTPENIALDLIRQFLAGKSETRG